jgi:hypothetical protein
MGGTHPPLLAAELQRPEFVNRDVVIAVLFLSPGRHAGRDGDIARICRESRVRCHPTGLVGDHPTVPDVLASALRDALAAHRGGSIPTEAGANVS